MRITEPVLCNRSRRCPCPYKNRTRQSQYFKFLSRISIAFFLAIDADLLTVLSPKCMIRPNKFFFRFCSNFIACQYICCLEALYSLNFASRSKYCVTCSNIGNFSQLSPYSHISSDRHVRFAITLKPAL